MKRIFVMLAVASLLVLGGTALTFAWRSSGLSVPCSSCSRITRTPMPEEPKATATLFETPVCYECATETPEPSPTFRNPSPPPPMWTLEPSPTYAEGRIP